MIILCPLSAEIKKSFFVFLLENIFKDKIRSLCPDNFFRILLLVKFIKLMKNSSLLKLIGTITGVIKIISLLLDLYGYFLEIVAYYF